MATWEERIRACAERLCDLPDASFEEIEATSAQLRRLLEDGCHVGCASSRKPATEKGETGGAAGAGEAGIDSESRAAADSAGNGSQGQGQGQGDSAPSVMDEHNREGAVMRVLQLLLSLLAGRKASLLIDRASWDILRFLSSPLPSSSTSSPFLSPPAPADASPGCCVLACQAVGEVASGAGDPREVHAALVEGLSGSMRWAQGGGGEGEAEGGEREGGEEGEEGGEEEGKTREERWSWLLAPFGTQLALLAGLHITLPRIPRQRHRFFTHLAPLLLHLSSRASHHAVLPPSHASSHAVPPPSPSKPPLPASCTNAQAPSSHPSPPFLSPLSAELFLPPPPPSPYPSRAPTPPHLAVPCSKAPCPAHVGEGGAGDAVPQRGMGGQESETARAGTTVPGGTAAACGVLQGGSVEGTAACDSAESNRRVGSGDADKGPPGIPLSIPPIPPMLPFPSGTRSVIPDLRVPPSSSREAAWLVCHRCMHLVFAAVTRAIVPPTTATATSAAGSEISPCPELSPQHVLAAQTATLLLLLSLARCSAFLLSILSSHPLPSSSHAPPTHPSSPSSSLPSQPSPPSPASPLSPSLPLISPVASALAALGCRLGCLWPPRSGNGATGASAGTNESAIAPSSTTSGMNTSSPTSSAARSSGAASASVTPPSLLPSVDLLALSVCGDFSGDDTASGGAPAAAGTAWLGAVKALLRPDEEEGEEEEEEERGEEGEEERVEGRRASSEEREKRKTERERREVEWLETVQGEVREGVAVLLLWVLLQASEPLTRSSSTIPLDRSSLIKVLGAAPCLLEAGFPSREGGGGGGGGAGAGPPGGGTMGGVGGVGGVADVLLRRVAGIRLVHAALDGYSPSCSPSHSPSLSHSLSPEALLTASPSSSDRDASAAAIKEVTRVTSSLARVMMSAVGSSALRRAAHRAMLRCCGRRQQMGRGWSVSRGWWLSSEKKA
ncbi:hypothetical protein CLOM_g9900 [Closterium sp. NIES-68]|nr:hypothetical protein CLOM_g9900 [Closterium sp. NIES-68]